MTRARALAVTIAVGAATVVAISGLAENRPIAQAPPSSAAGAGAGVERAQSELLHAPLSFVANTGALDDRVAFWLPGADAGVYLTDTGLTYRLAGPEPSADSSAAPAWVVRQEFLGAAPVRPVGSQASPTTVNFFKGGPDQWVTSVPTAAAVTYHGLWPGIDATYGGTGERLKYEFSIAPGADPGAVRLAYRGAEQVTMTATGELRVDSPAGGFTDAAPTAYQLVGGEKRPIAVSYALAPADVDGSQPYGFEVGAYDPALPLVVDPATIVYAGFVGGSSTEEGNGIAVDAAGAAYVIGNTRSGEADFPETVGPDLTFGGDTDVFVAKVTPDGTGLVYAGFVGGSSRESGEGIAVDSSGAAYITGETGSDTDFPVVVGGLDTSYNGGSFGCCDAFVAKVAPDGSALAYSGFIGGSDRDIGYGIAVDGSGAAYVAGMTGSSQTTFPVLVGPGTTYGAGPTDGDAFVAKVLPGGTGLAYAGYIGGDRFDQGRAIAVDGAGNAYVAGSAQSTEATFPETVGPVLTHSGGADAFVAEVKPDGSALLYAGYIGGNSGDGASGIAVDGSGAAYVTGSTRGGATFPGTVGPDLSHNGNSDAFVAKVLPGGTGFAYAGYIGGSEFDVGGAIAVDATGSAYVVGSTVSSAAELPAVNGPARRGGEDAFVAKVAPDGTTLPMVGFVGGDGWEEGNGIALDGTGAAYIVGTPDTEAISDASTFPVTVGPDISGNGGGDAFVAKLSPVDATPPATPMVVATATSTTRIALTWGAVSGATAYQVYRSESPTGPYGPPKVVTTNGYANTGRTPGTTYYYVVRATSPDGSSPDSAPAGATTPATAAAPTNLAVTGTTATKVTLSWDSVAGATSYQVRRSTSLGGPYSPVASTAATTLTDTTAAPGTAYYYVVAATSAAGTSANSNEATATTLTLPSPPANVVATPTGSTKVSVTWDPVGGATAYEVWHATTSGGAYTKKATVSGTSYLHTTAVAGTANYYVVRSVTPAGTSANSAEATATTPAPPSPPTTVVATPVTSTTVSVTWTSVPGATAYEVWRSNTAGGPYAKKRTVTGTSYSDTTASAATTYFYVVRTVSPTGTSANSTQATATTP